MALGWMRRDRQEFSPPKLNITSMMDMFTIILIFLLFSFSNEVVTMKIDEDIALPHSSAKLDFEDNIRIVVSKDSIWLGDEVIGQIKDDAVVGLDPAHVKDSVLYKRLKGYRLDKDDMRKNSPKANHILFLCDKRLSFRTINSVIKTAGMAGFPNFQFGVLRQ